MNRQELLDVLTTRPFHPLRMYVSGGATYLIRHPDLVWVSRTSAYVGVPEGDQAGPAIERQNIVDLGHITRIEQIEQSMSSDG